MHRVAKDPELGYETKDWVGALAEAMYPASWPSRRISPRR